MSDVVKIFENRQVNTSTGEIESCRTSKVTYFHEDKGYLFMINRKKVSSFPEFDFPEGLPDSDIGKLYWLAKHTHTNSNLIFYRSHNSIKPATISQMAKYIKLSERRATIFINKMIKKRILGLVTVKVGESTEAQYYINPLYFFNGKWLSSNLYFLFHDDLKPCIPRYVADIFETNKPQVQTNVPSK